jgi:protein pelota
MKVLKSGVVLNGEGTIKITCEESDDMWHAYNLLQKGDKVTAFTFRKVQKETSSGSVFSDKMKLKLTIQVEKVDFDAVAGEIRVSGRNVEENEFVKLGQYHTLELAVARSFWLWKPYWDKLDFERIEEASTPSARAELAVVLMQQGLAHVVILTSSLTILLAKIETSIPGKRAIAVGADKKKSLNKFYSQVIEAMKMHLRFEVLKCIVVASPGFYKDEFLAFMFSEASRTEDKLILENRSKFIAVASTSGHMQVLSALLKDPTVLSQIEETKTAKDVQSLNKFFSALQENPDKAFYGYKHVLLAEQACAIDTLLITDDLFRTEDVSMRKEYIRVMDSVRDNGGNVSLFSSMHPAGEQLAKMTGIAAILRFPMPDIELVAQDSDEEEIVH